MAKVVVSAIVVALLLSVTFDGASAASVEVSPATQCEALEKANFSTIQDAPAEITAVNWVAAKGAIPTHCQVAGYVSPQVGFQLGLPADWNGKFFETGCGGSCGDISDFEQSRRCGEPLLKGYACIAFDGGHVGEKVWALNNLQAQVDFGYRGAHVTALAGRAIVEHYYGRAPTYAYFCGCSTGGRFALVEAQRFPWDFNGIISGAPWINDTDSAMNFCVGLSCSTWSRRKAAPNSRQP